MNKKITCGQSLVFKWSIYFLQSATLNKHIRSHQKGLRELAADKIQKQKARKYTNEANIEKVRERSSNVLPGFLPIILFRIISVQVR